MTGGEHNHPAHTEKIEKIIQRNQAVQMVSRRMQVISCVPSNDIGEDHLFINKFENDIDDIPVDY